MRILGIAAVLLASIAPPPGGLPLTSAAYGAPECEWCGAADAPANLSWKTTIAPPGEPGPRLVVSGVVYERDGKTPAPNVLIYLYHTDLNGVYSRGEGKPGNAPRHGLLRSWMRTGADGKYEFDTIRPGSYPNTRNPSHIHITLSRVAPSAQSADAAHPAAEEFYIDEYWFADDPFVTEQQKSRSRAQANFGHVVITTPDAGGTLRAVRDLKFDPPATPQPRG